MEQQCGFCIKVNHYAKFCMSKEVHNLQEVEDSNCEESKDDSSLFVYSVGSSCVSDDEQFTKLLR